MTKRRPAADYRLYVGAGESGKTASMKQQVADDDPARLMIFDAVDQWRDFAPAVATLDGVRQKLIASGGGAVRLRYVPMPRKDTTHWPRQYSDFCSLAWAAGKLTLVGEEMAFMLTPGRSSGGWKALSLLGRHDGVNLRVATQSPRLIDRLFFGTCSYVRCFRLNDDEDKKRMREVLSLERGELEALRQLDYIERNMKSGEKKVGRLTF